MGEGGKLFYQGNSVEEVCVFCRRRKATKLCDYPVGAWKLSVDFITRRFTCDHLICDECAINIAPDTDFCPQCAAKAVEKLIGRVDNLEVLERALPILLNRRKELMSKRK